MFVISCANQKGGVGKTTTAVSLATEFAMKGFKTLLIDSDAQANATGNFVSPGSFTHSLYDVVVEEGDMQSLPIKDVVISTGIDNLDLVPSRLKLSTFDMQPPDMINILKAKLTEVSDYYEFVVIDNPPSLSQLLMASLIASTHVLIPVAAEPMAHDGIDDFLRTFHRVASRSNKNLALLGMVTTKFDGRLAVHGNVHQQLLERYPEYVFDTIIHQNSKLVESPAFHQPIQTYSPQSRGSQNYNSLAEEILVRLGNPKPKSINALNQSQDQVGAKG
jgi:chromosome partitioning protein